MGQHCSLVAHWVSVPDFGSSNSVGGENFPSFIFESGSHDAVHSNYFMIMQSDQFMN